MIRCMRRLEGIEKTSEMILWLLGLLTERVEAPLIEVECQGEVAEGST